ncbi:hypothetical protein LEP1GSC005_0501 [Leptospira santarosai str. ST188]|nr:hypothetical protein LEP1GSC005_0501 [Leptospira santarosai str. ST188]
MSFLWNQTVSFFVLRDQILYQNLSQKRLESRFLRIARFCFAKSQHCAERPNSANAFLRIGVQGETMSFRSAAFGYLAYYGSLIFALQRAFDYAPLSTAISLSMDRSIDFGTRCKYQTSLYNSKFSFNLEVE